MDDFQKFKESQHARELMIKRNAQILIKEYLIELYLRLAEHVNNNECLKEINKLIVTLKNEIKKYSTEAEDLKVIAALEYESERDDYVKKIEDENASTMEKCFFKYTESEKLYLQKKAFCEEVAKYIENMEKKLNNAKNDEFKTVLISVIEELKKQKKESDIELKNLKAQYDEYDKQMGLEIQKIYKIYF